METMTFLQHYWWLVISLLGALLVFLLFVQGGQSLIYGIGKTDEERTMLVNALGRKWETTFTTLVTFGGAFFASFPLFYSTSFGGAFYIWMLILFVFVIQAVAYEFRSKPHNVFGRKTYDLFLMLNGIAGPLLLGVAVATLSRAPTSPSTASTSPIWAATPPFHSGLRRGTDWKPSPIRATSHWVSPWSSFRERSAASTS